jgi:nucleoid DNA-binding protein
LPARAEPKPAAKTPVVHYDLVGMKKEQLARRLAKESHMTAGAAADQVDRILNDLFKRVRKGQSASLPGLGTFRSGRDQDFQFDGSLPRVAERVKSKKERQ